MSENPEIIPDEVARQLAFLAYHMTIRAKENLTDEELQSALAEMRNERPDILLPGQENALLRAIRKDNLILRRTHEEERKGVSDVRSKFAVRPFQEYLTALAAASGFYPDYQK